jgi:ribonuclease P protein component
LRDGRRFRYPKSSRVRQGQEIRALLRYGQKHQCGVLELFLSRASGERSRAGVVVPLYGRTSVQRNRLKRRLRELLRTMCLPEAVEGRTGQQILIQARPGAYDMGFTELRETFRRCMEIVRCDA